MKIIGVYKVKGEKNVHLFELIIEEKPSLVDVGGFTQEIKGEDSSNWQVPWDEKYLDEEGMEVIGDDYKKPQEDKSPTRMIFFLHFLDLKKPLKTPYGDFDIPKPIDLPERLVGKVNYENPD